MFASATPGGVVAARAATQRVERARPSHSSHWSPLLLTLLALTACDKALTEPRMLDPAALERVELTVLSGGDQEAVVGEALTEPLTVLVVDSLDNPIPDAPVTWTFGAGRGNGRGDPTRAARVVTLISDASGELSVEWQLGTTAGPQQAWAEIGTASTVGAEERVPGAAPEDAEANQNRGKRVGFQATRRPSHPVQISVSDASLSLDVGEADTLGVVVRDQYGNEITDATVEWTSSEPAVSEVDANGIVTALHPGVAMVTASERSLTADAEVSVNGSGGGRRHRPRCPGRGGAAGDSR